MVHNNFIEGFEHNYNFRDTIEPNFIGAWPQVTISNWHSKMKMTIAATTTGIYDEPISVTGEALQSQPHWLSSLTLAPLVGFFNNKTHIETRNAWESYSVRHAQEWIQEQHEALPIVPYIYDPTITGDGTKHDEAGLSVHLPLWQTTPVSQRTRSVNCDGLKIPLLANTVSQILVQHHETDASWEADTLLSPISLERNVLDPANTAGSVDEGSVKNPYSLLVQPVYDRLGTRHIGDPQQPRQVVAFLIAVISWRDFL